MSNKLLRADQVERRLACSRTTVCKLCREGHLRGFKVGSQWRIYEHSVQEYIEKTENPCVSCVA